ncbi:MAG: UbiA family prenyltransferase [Candidatus Micrarchaeota archaeon]|nr:UbiA family prenyltransferase [Candidatus Micrarchaeota archaeon]
MNKIAAIARLTRIEHSAMLIIAVLAGELISGGIPQLQTLALSMITPIFVSMGSFAINDYFDVEADIANRRMNRPIAAGHIKMKEALAVAIASFVIGVAASAFINVYASAIALIFAALAVLYSYRMKEMLLVGNVYIALSMVIPFIYGNFVVASSINYNIILISIIIFLAGLAREIHGMVRDYEGDKKARNVRNLVFHVGERKSSAFALTLYCEAIAISIFMFFFMKPFAGNIFYLGAITIVDAMLLYVAIGSLRNGSSRRFSDMSRNISLGAMALALVVYLISPLLHLAL